MTVTNARFAVSSYIRQLEAEAKHLGDDCSDQVLELAAQLALLCSQPSYLWWTGYLPKRRNFTEVFDDLASLDPDDDRRVAINTLLKHHGMKS